MKALYAILVAIVLSSCGSPATPNSTTNIFEGRLLFARFTESSHTFTGMFVSKSDGSALTTIPMPWTEGGGRWSRNGMEIAVATLLSDSRIGTTILAPDGKALRTFEIPDQTLNLVCLVWTRDNSRLACQGWDDTNPSVNGIYSVRASDGGDLKRITTAPQGGNDEPGDYSSDGHLVFIRVIGDEPPGLLMLIDSNGGEPRLLYGGQMEDPGRFSPDGLSVLTSAQGVLVVIDLKGTVLHKIAVTGSYLFGPVWSPDGSRIAFSMDVVRGPFADIFTSLPDGTDLLQVTNTADNEIAVDWGTDNR